MTDQLPAIASVDFDRSGSTQTAYLAGELDPASCPAVAARVVGELVGVRRLVLNLAEVTFCDSSGLGLFVALHHAMVGSDGTLTLQDPTPTLRRLLKVAGLIDLFDIHGIG